MNGEAEQGQQQKLKHWDHMMGDANIRAKCQNYLELSWRYPRQLDLCGEECIDLELPHYSVEQWDGVVPARDLGDTSLVVDGYGQGGLLGSEEAKGVTFEFQAVMDLLEMIDLEAWAWGMVFTNPAV